MVSSPFWRVCRVVRVSLTHTQRCCSACRGGAPEVHRAAGAPGGTHRPNHDPATKRRALEATQAHVCGMQRMSKQLHDLGVLLGIGVGRRLGRAAAAASRRRN
jgi:hypothetical protein